MIHARTMDQAGMTLVEAMVTIVLVGVAFAALMGGLWTSVVASDYNVKRTTAEATARAYLELIKRTPYTNCASSYDTSGFVSPGFTASIVDVDYWDPVSGTFVESCPTTDAGLQLVQTQVVSSDAQVRETLDVVKRRASLS